MNTPTLFDDFHNTVSALTPGHRNTDPDTSREAAARQRVTDRRLALNLHRQHPDGLTDFELADLMGRQQTSAGKRRGELRDLGYVEDSGQRRPAPSGAKAIVWRITEQGMA
jgi:hypothetical protein